MTDDEKLEYELALQIGKARFGSPCEHAEAEKGFCLNCLRRVVNVNDSGLIRNRGKSDE
ncbi:MAG: hypothetical protein AB7V04_03880 [Desulfomonilaceae bacterium]